MFLALLATIPCNGTIYRIQLYFLSIRDVFLLDVFSLGFFFSSLSLDVIVGISIAAKPSVVMVNTLSKSLWKFIDCFWEWERKKAAKNNTLHFLFLSFNRKICWIETIKNHEKNITIIIIIIFITIAYKQSLTIPWKRSTIFCLVWIFQYSN